MSYSETPISECKCGVFLPSAEGSTWDSIDGGISTVTLCRGVRKHSDGSEEETFRLVAKASTNQYCVNSWIKRDTILKRISDSFVTISSSTNIGTSSGLKLYGFSFADESTVTSFASVIQNSIQSLTQWHNNHPLLPTGKHSATDINPISLEITKTVTPPPPLVTSPSGTTANAKTSEPTLPNSLSLSPAIQARAQLQRRSSLSAKELREKYRSLRVKTKFVKKEEGRNVKISIGKNISLNKIAKSFEEEAMNLIRNTNRCVLDRKVQPSIISLKKINEMLLMVLILTQKTDFSSLVHKMMQAMNDYISRFPNNCDSQDQPPVAPLSPVPDLLPAPPATLGNLDTTVIEACKGRAMKLVKASLVKKIHVELIGVQNLTIQITCSITYIANIDIDHVAMTQLFATIRAFYVAVTRLVDAVATLKYIEENTTSPQVLSPPSQRKHTHSRNASLQRSPSGSGSSSPVGHMSRSNSISMTTSPLASSPSMTTSSLSNGSHHRISPTSSAAQLPATISLYYNPNGMEGRLEKMPSFTNADEQVNVYCESLQELMELKENKEEIRLGTLNQLILKLTSVESYDNKFMKTFISTYRSFTDPWTLLDKLRQRYYMPESHTAEKLTTVQFRVAVVLKYWVENQLDDFDEDLVQSVYDFIQAMSEQENLKKTAESLMKYLDEKIEQRERSTVLWFQEPERVDFPEEGLCLSDLFLELPAQVIAEQLTLIDYEIFHKIETAELLNQSWNKPNLKHRAFNVVALIQRSTRVSYWVATMVLSQDHKTYRLKMFEQMIEVCKILERLNNFNTLMGIIAGLNLSSVHRLSASYKNSKNDTLKKLERLMLSEGNYSNYRKALSAASAPCLPYLGVHLTDLVFIEDGNPDRVNNLINFKKRDLSVETIRTLQNFQSTPYKIEMVEPVYTFLHELPFVQDKELYNISIFLEAKKKSQSKK